jgi:hypothetical protein
MFRLPRTLRLAAYLSNSVLVAGCAEPMIDAGPPSSAEAVTAGPDGWTVVTQPGWMHVAFPQPPKSFNRWDHTHQGQYTYRELVDQSADGFQELRMVEYRGAKDIAEARAGLHQKMAMPPPGVHLEKMEPVSIGGAEGETMTAHVDAKSATNGAPFPLVERIEVVWQGGRAFWMDCAVPVEKAANCERFLSSFTLESATP